MHGECKIQFITSSVSQPRFGRTLLGFLVRNRAVNEYKFQNAAKIFLISRDFSREILSNWQLWSNFHALLTASLSCFG
jgi:hypothetical protein